MANRRSSRAKKPISSQHNVTATEEVSNSDQAVPSQEKPEQVTSTEESSRKDGVPVTEDKEDNSNHSKSLGNGTDDDVTLISERSTTATPSKGTLDKFFSFSPKTAGSSKRKLVDSEVPTKISEDPASKRGRDDEAENSKENDKPSAQEERLLELQKTISKRAKKDTVNPIPVKEKADHDKVLSNLNAIRAKSKPLRTVNSSISDKGKSKAKGNLILFTQSNKISLINTLYCTHL